MQKRFGWYTSCLLMTGLATLLVGPVMAKTPSADVTETLARFHKADPSLAAVIKAAAGYALFPSVKKAGLGIGGARSSGEVVESGAAVGKASLSQLSIRISGRRTSLCGIDSLRNAQGSGRLQGQQICVWRAG